MSKKFEETPHDSAHLHVTGASVFIDDKPSLPDELQVGLLLSPHAKALIKSIDIKKARTSPGIKGIFLASDLHHNHWGSIFGDQPLLADGEVSYVGEVVAIIAGVSKMAVKKASLLIEVDYEVASPILSIEDAIKKQSFIGDKKQIITGDVDEAFRNATHELSDTISLKGAEHFYLENQTALVYPLEDGHLLVHSSTQHPTEVQAMVAECLGIHQSEIVCIAHRLGGGFGGKETQAAPFAVYAALVAHKTGQSARLVLSKDEDMIITGKRNPYEINYRVGFDNDGIVQALDVEFYGDAGAYADLSSAILERAMAHVDNAYYLAHARITGVLCRTNFQPTTAFRGFGGPKGVAVIEHIMEAIAHHIKCDALDVRMRNCYQKDRDITPYGQKVDNNQLPTLFKQLEESCDYRARRKQLDIYNQDKQNNPRGMSLCAIKFGISFTTRFLNQGHAFIHLFRDGSVQVATGAVEMGQGVAVRIKSIVASAFGVPIDKVRILSTATDKSANTSPTAASSGTDLNGSAALNACNSLKNHLKSLFVNLSTKPRDLWPQKTAALASCDEHEPENKEYGDISFSNNHVFYTDKPDANIPLVDLINAAYLSRIPLSAYGFYKTPHLDFNKATGKGRAFLYFTQGVACSEVEIDRFLGAAKVLRTDILMDLGNPINRAMDMGQITGGFVQGLGWILSENLFYDDVGALKSHGPSTYKIPSVHDMPRIFNVELLENDGNTVNLYGTKASGEPPLMLCFSIWNALKDAIRSYHGHLINLPVPATNEILLASLNAHV